MKKILLLSVVASSILLAGGDIAPVEEVAPEVSMWDFSGQAVAFLQTVDAHNDASLFDHYTTYGSVGLQLRAVNKDIFAGIGAGVEVSGIAQSEKFSHVTLQTDTNPNGFRFPFQGGGDAQVESAAITQVYLTYGFGNTALKIGRQTLPKSLSPFAYTEGWQVFKNTLDAALVVNTDLPDTTLVYAAVGAANSSIGRLDSFDKINENGNVVHMLTAQNKSFEGLTLTGTYYYAPDMVGNGLDANILWGDAKYKFSDYLFAVQGGQLSGDTLEDTNAFGVMAAGKWDIFGASVAYSSVSDGDLRVTNLATGSQIGTNPDGSQKRIQGVKSPLYTQMVLDNIGNHQAINSDWIKVAANAKLFGGKLGLAWGMAIDNNSPFSGETGSAFGKNPYEVDVTYKIKVFEDVTLFAAYVYTDRDHNHGIILNPDGTQKYPVHNEDGDNFVRLWARYNF